MDNKKPLNFTDLFVWRKGHLFVLELYSITKTFPKDELYGLVSQMRRAAVSITSNIAEGFTRKHKKEKKQFYFISLGSTTELQNQLIIAKDLHYLLAEKAEELISKTIELSKLLNSLINSLNNP